MLGREGILGGAEPCSEDSGLLDGLMTALTLPALLLIHSPTSSPGLQTNFQCLLLTVPL